MNRKTLGLMITAGLGLLITGCATRTAPRSASMAGDSSVEDRSAIEAESQSIESSVKKAAGKASGPVKSLSGGIRGEAGGEASDESIEMPPIDPQNDEPDAVK